jgi:trk system potassium uptake protein TrkA
MKPTVVVVGAGEVGSYLARFLSHEGYTVKVIDLNGEKLRALQEQMDIGVIQGSGASPADLRRAECSSANLLLATTDSDDANLVACLVAKKLGVKRTIARIRHLESHGGHHFYRNQLGIDLVVDPDSLAAVEVENLVRETGTVGVEYFADGNVQLSKIVLDERCRMLGIPLSEVEFPPGGLVVAIIRGSEIVVPSGEDTLQPGDQVMVITRAGDRSIIRRIFSGTSPQSKYVMILGGSRIARTIAARLAGHRITTKLIEADRTHSWEISRTLERVQVIHGDATDIDLLRSEYIKDVDLLIAAEGRDELNIISCLMARELGAKKTVAIIERGSYLPLAGKLKVDVTLSPRLLAAGKILAFALSPNIHSLSLVGDGAAEVLEFVLPRNSSAAGKPLAELGLPAGVIVAAVSRDGEVIIPRGFTVLRDEDTIIVFALAEHVPQIAPMFT